MPMPGSCSAKALTLVSLFQNALPRLNALLASAPKPLPAAPPNERANLFVSCVALLVAVV